MTKRERLQKRNAVRKTVHKVLRGGIDVTAFVQELRVREARKSSTRQQRLSRYEQKQKTPPEKLTVPGVGVFERKSKASTKEGK